MQLSPARYSCAIEVFSCDTAGGFYHLLFFCIHLNGVEVDIKKVPTLVGIYQCFLSCAHRKSGEFKSNRFILFNDEKNIQVAI